MSDFIFATFLYAAMICFVCCLRYQPSSTKDASEVGESQPTSVSTDHGSLHIVLDPSKLTLRQCRAVIREINKGLPKLDRIRQKINGKDAPADWLRSQIARHLETHPDEAMAIEEILKAG